MPKASHKPSLQSLLWERLNYLGATNLPAAALVAIRRDVLLVCTRAVARAVTGPAIGRAVAAALSAPADTGQGIKGGTPLTSSQPARNAREGVAGLTYNLTVEPVVTRDSGVSNQPTGESV